MGQLTKVGELKLCNVLMHKTFNELKMAPWKPLLLIASLSQADGQLAVHAQHFPAS